ncbi:unnamed protein product [Cylindrotheca closterium]|uniref:VDE lipocalin domain-containing protein n=1 Tax=Cylindrotheca closterium TaxID=2856 RepID=A0AAD2FI60_9STRA|nr:unnamed protein product [Cylindrotheca closterium]
MDTTKTKVTTALIFSVVCASSNGFINMPTNVPTIRSAVAPSITYHHQQRQTTQSQASRGPGIGDSIKTIFASSVLVASLVLGAPAGAENELSDKYGGRGFDSSVVDQTCLVDKCSNQAKACLADDPSCRKGLTCTAKCLGDNSCITGCMARYGDKNLDNFLKCTIEDNECIKIAILSGGSDPYGKEPRSPAPTVRDFDYESMQGTWYKVVGFNPNYDCYQCQRNSFHGVANEQKKGTPNDISLLQVGVEFSMPHLIPDGSPLPPKNTRESILVKNDVTTGMKSIGLNEYNTNEIMIFDKVTENENKLIVSKGMENEASFSRTAHSEGEMFGLILGKLNTYEGAFVYSRSKELEPESMAKVYSIAKKAGMDPEKFCRIQNGCFNDDNSLEPRVAPPPPESIPFRGIMASTKVSELLGVEAVSARDYTGIPGSVAEDLQPKAKSPSRPWWYEVGDYLENPRRHFDYMNSMRQNMDWPKEVQEWNQ